MYKEYYPLFASLARKWKSLLFHFARSLANKKITKKGGFTLIELLVVIAILAVLATAVVIILNPGQLIRQARDSTRISDLAALHSAIALYLSDFSTPVIGTTATGFCNYGANTKGTQVCTQSSSTVVTNGGWVPINFTGISSGSPLARLPLDPNDSTNCGTAAAEKCFYQYLFASSSLTYELNASMESTKYANGGVGSDVESTDGGSNANAYEIGNDPGLDL